MVRSLRDELLIALKGDYIHQERCGIRSGQGGLTETRRTFIARSNRCVKPRVLWHSSLRSYTLQGHNYWSRREHRLWAPLFPFQPNTLGFVIDSIGGRNGVEASSRNLCQIMLNMQQQSNFCQIRCVLVQSFSCIVLRIGKCEFLTLTVWSMSSFCSVSCLKCIMLFNSLKKDLVKSAFGINSKSFVILFLCQTRYLKYYTCIYNT